MRRDGHLEAPALGDDRSDESSDQEEDSHLHAEREQLGGDALAVDEPDEGDAAAGQSRRDAAAEAEPHRAQGDRRDEEEHEQLGGSGVEEAERDQADGKQHARADSEIATHGERPDAPP